MATQTRDVEKGWQSRRSHVISFLIPPVVCSIFLFLLMVYFWPKTSGYLADTIRYVDAAMNFRDTGKMVLSRYQLYSPALLETWEPRVLSEQPPLYPFLIAVVSMTGLDYVASSRLITAAFYILLPFIVWLLIRKIFSGFVAFASLVAIVSTYGFLKSSLYGLTESLGTFLLMSVVFVALELGADLRSGRGSWALLILSVFLYGLSVSARFTSAFVLPALGLWLFRAGEGRKKLVQFGVWAGVCCGITLGLFSLKIVFAGPYGLPEFGPLPGSTFVSNAKSAVILPAADILFGGSDSTLTTKVGVLVALIAVVLGVISVARRASKKTIIGFLLEKPEGLIALGAASYVIILWLVTSTQTVYPVYTRYLIPIYPFLILLLMRLAVEMKPLGVRALGKVLAVAIAVLCVTGNSLAIARVNQEVSLIHRPIQTITWLERNAAKSDVIISNCHFLGYWLNRPCLYLPREWYHGKVFSEADAEICARSTRRVWLVIFPRGHFGYDAGPYIADVMLGKKMLMCERYKSFEDGELYLFGS